MNSLEQSCKNLFLPIPIQSANDSLIYRITKLLHTLLPKSFFCWISRCSIQIPSIFLPLSRPYWTKISDEIYLGAIPLKNWDQHQKIYELGVKSVLSINEDYEFQPLPFSSPVQTSDWQEKNICHLKISSPDLKPISLHLLAKAVDFVAEQSLLGPVYIHCTGGRGRSVSVAIAAFSKLKNLSIEKSTEHVKQCRPQTIISQLQLQAITSWHHKSISNKTFKYA